MNKNLKAAIIKKFGKQYLFAREIGVQETTISEVIQGRRELNPDQKKEWCRILECKPSEVFNRVSN